MILVQDFAGLVDVDLGAGALCPGQHGQPLDVVAGERVVGGHGRHAAEAGKLLESFFLHLLGHAGFVDLLAQFLDLALALVLLAKLLLDGLHLLAQVVVALRLLHLVLDLVLDLGAELLDFDFLGQVSVDELQARGDAGGFKQLLLVVGGQERQRRGDEIDQAAGLFDVRGDGAQFVGKCRRLGDDLLELADDDADQGFNAGVGFGSTFSSVSTSAIMNGSVWIKRTSAHPLHAFGEDEAALVGHPDHLVNRGQGANRVHVVGSGSIQAGIFLRGYGDGALFAQRLNQLDGAFPADGKWQHGMGKQDGVPDRQDGDAPHGARGFAGLWRRNRIGIWH